MSGSVMQNACTEDTIINNHYQYNGKYVFYKLGSIICCKINFLATPSLLVTIFKYFAIAMSLYTKT